MGDAINAGQDSDRMVIRWDLMAVAPAVASSRPEPETASAVTALANTDDRPGEYARPPAGARTALVGVPRDIETLRAQDTLICEEPVISQRPSVALPSLHPRSVADS